ncbi:MAG: alpha/beta fold hydrolase [Hyphomonadaceae bacterium]
MTASSHPVLLLHGWGGSFASAFDPYWTAPLQARGRSIIRMDLPGHGAGASTDPEHYADLASLVAARLPSEPLDAVGFSLGGKIVLALAAKKPSRFRRVVVGGVGDNAFAPEPSGEDLASALIDPIGAAASSQIVQLARYGIGNGNDPAALAAVLRRPANPVLETAALALVGDTLVVNSTADTIAMSDDRLCRALTRCRHVQVDAVGHLALLDDRRFREAAIAFLQTTAEVDA